MSTEDRLDTYLKSRAGRLDVPTGDPAEAVERAAERRRSRRALGSGLVAGVVVLGAVAVMGTRRSDEGFGTGAPAGPDSTALPPIAGVGGALDLQWTTVDVDAGGLGGAGSRVLLDDGSLFAISTSPGAVDRNDPDAAYLPALYRSADGRSWDPRTLPDGLRPSSLSTDGQQLYAVGTAPAGGGVEAVVAVSGDGAASWSAVSRVPLPEVAVMAAYPGEVDVGGVHVAVGPSGAVATATVMAEPDYERRLANLGVSVADYGWSTSAGGITLEGEGLECGGADAPVPAPPSVSTTMAPTTTGPGSANEPPNEPPNEGEVPVFAPELGTVPGSAPSKEDVERCRNGAAPVAGAHYTWAELGIGPDLAALIDGQMHVFHAPPGGAFTEVAFPVRDRGRAQALVSDGSGFRVLLGDGQGDALRQLRSTDGVRWVSSGPDMAGFARSVGTLDGRPAVVVDGTRDLLLVATPDGWTSTDLSRAIDEVAGLAMSVQDVAVGPLGVVAIVQQFGPGNATDTAVLTSADGRQFAVADVDGLGSGRQGWYAVGVEMNPDAVVIRVQPPPGDVPVGEPDTRQRLLVGTRA